MHLSKLCIGCEALGGTDWGDFSIQELKYAIDKSIDLGINFFDTAGVYGLGLSEKRLARVLGKRKNNLIIATKGGLTWEKINKDSRAQIKKNSSKKALRKDVISSLKRLGMDFLPIFYIHWPDKNTPFDESFEELSLMKKEGLIKAIGCSNFSVNQLKMITKKYIVDYVQIPLNIINRKSQIDMLKICNENNIKVVAYNVLFSGMLTGKFKVDTNFPKNDRRSRLPDFDIENFGKNLNKIETFRKKAEINNLSLLNYSIKEILNIHGIVSVITGIKNYSQLYENYLATI